LAGQLADVTVPVWTLYGLADSPVGLAAWMLDYDAKSYEDGAHSSLTGNP
jgi:hypothetical protein